ncbi:hypothetical protein GHO42_21650 [Pseudomonas sp. FSL R10-0056]|nr:hypothetical protein [Pseudomonas sp. FSL R10-0056]MQT70893.1 hypothetical protein [Pseudomonas sp. FSL R10-0071]MQU50069.1 hypothetical protein [Pseudomonas sp. FSL A6-1183]
MLMPWTPSSPIGRVEPCRFTPRPNQGLQSRSCAAIVRLSLPIQRTGFAARPVDGATAPPSRLQALFLCLPFCVMAAVRGTPSGVPDSVYSGLRTRVQLPPFVSQRLVAAPMK